MTNLTEQVIKENIELEKRNNGLHKLISELEAENTKLKELLKECKALLSYLQIDDYDNNGLLVLTKINQVLADNKIQANTVACNKIQENE